MSNAGLGFPMTVFRMCGALLGLWRSSAGQRCVCLLLGACPSGLAVFNLSLVALSVNWPGDLHHTLLTYTEAIAPASAHLSA